MIYNNISKIKTADEIKGDTYLDKQIDRIKGLCALRDSWMQVFREGGPRDIVYVAKLQQRIRALRKNAEYDE